MNNINLADSFGKLISKFYFVRKGCQIERRDGGYAWNRQFFKTIEDLDEAITKVYGRLGDSVNKIK